ncbi:glutathione S-transferase kappa 1 isoform X1 [Taeniopygia guttata]|uniref:glutathione S-transferase kappa 1 isoform X1 n=1 Tax=Taeniopygia guttata TaxID=59729 RepID=UPI003BB98E51
MDRAQLPAGPLRSCPCSSSRVGTLRRATEASGRGGGAGPAGEAERAGRWSGPGVGGSAPPRRKGRPALPGRCCGRRRALHGTARSQDGSDARGALLRCDLPVLLAGVRGNKPPAMLPKRGEYMLKDLKRMAKYYQVPVHMSPDAFQHIMGTSSLTAMRFITAIDMTNPQYLEPLSREFWIRFWSQHEDISEPESILAVARQAGLSAELSQKALEMISSPTVKDRLKDTTAEVLKYGAFGMPAVVAHYDGEPHLFFGSDRLELLGSILGEKWLGPVPSPKL